MNKFFAKWNLLGIGILSVWLVSFTPLKGQSPASLQPDNCVSEPLTRLERVQPRRLQKTSFYTEYMLERDVLNKRHKTNDFRLPELVNSSKKTLISSSKFPPSPQKLLKEGEVLFENNYGFVRQGNSIKSVRVILIGDRKLKNGANLDLDQGTQAFRRIPSIEESAKHAFRNSLEQLPATPNTALFDFGSQNKSHYSLNFNFPLGGNSQIRIHNLDETLTNIFEIIDRLMCLISKSPSPSKV